MLLVLLCTLIAAVFGSTFERPILAETAFERSRLGSPSAAGAAPESVEASVHTPAARRSTADAAVAFGLAQAEPLLLLLLGSMLFCVAGGISLVVSRVKPD